MNAVFLIALSFLFMSCAHSPQAKVTQPQSLVAPRTVSSDPKSDEVVNRDATPPADNQVKGPVVPNDDEAPTPITSGRKLNIPANQEELSARCEKALETIPENYKAQTNDFPIHHRALSLSYNARHRIPNWVFYNLHRDNLLHSCAKRKDNFRGDNVLAAAQIPKDLIIDGNGYKNSGFDRGHMAPSGDFTWDEAINNETFFMTNMSPQTAELNQKTWNSLEQRVRRWACGMGQIKVYTGPIIEPDMKRLNSCVSIPNKFFKVVVGLKDKKLVGIGFIYDQTDGKGDPYRERAVSIRKVEELSGLNFFKDEYAQKVQDEFETQFNIQDWDSSEENCYACNGVIKEK